MNHRYRLRLHDLVAFAILLLALLVVLFPSAWILLTSFKPAAILSQPATVSFSPTLTHWNQVFHSDFPRQLLNSVIVGLVTVFIALLVGCPAAYAFSRYHVGGPQTRFGILLAQMLPPAVLIVPLFLLMYHLRLLDTLVAVTAAHLTFILPLVTWFLISFFDEVPHELEEQAMVDGCTPWQAFYRVVIPVIRPGLRAAGLFAFVLSWSDLFYALLLTGGKSKTLPVAIAGFWTFRGIEMGKMAVAIVVAIVPVLILSFLVQRHLVKGLGAGAVKY